VKVSTHSILLGTAVACAMLVHAPAQAADAGGRFGIRGYGSRACAAFNAEVSDPVHAANYSSWLMGYSTAHNRLRNDTFDILPLADGVVLLRAVAAVCAQHQDIVVEEAANAVVRALQPLVQQRETPTISIERDGKNVRIRQGALELLQSKLAERGIYSGPADGVWSVALGDSIETFQKLNNLPVSGFPDLATMIKAIVL
jgi:hypothetical protein